VARPLPAPAGGSLFPDDLEVVTLPLLQALLSRWDLSDGRSSHRPALDWCDRDDRVSYIVNLFRSRQQHAPLFGPPFAPEAEAALLAGRLA
jgi:hypothetical protein